MVTLEEMKQYLRVDGADEDGLIQSLMDSAEAICKDVVRNEASDVTSAMRIAVLYTVSYLYEHREEADHGELMRSLRALLMGERKSAF